MTYLTNIRLWLTGFVLSFLRTLDVLVEQHKLVRRSLVLWATWLITWATLQIFMYPNMISEAAASAYTVLVGVLGVVLGFYQWMRNKDDNGKADS